MAGRIRREVRRQVPYPCASCNREVRPQQHALECDVCGQWQHRTCGTGITQPFYFALLRKEVELPEFRCCNCPQIVAEEEVIEEVIDRTNDDIQIDEAPNMEELANDEAPNEEAMNNAEEPNDEAANNDEEPTNDNEPYNAPNNDPMDISFAIATSFAEAPDIAEISMADPNPTVDVLPDEPVTFRIVEKGSQRGGDLLVDSDGYSYNYKTTKTSTATGNVTTYWTCSVRNPRGHTCYATARETNGNYLRGAKEHDHPGSPGLATTKIIVRDLKTMARNDAFGSAGTMVNQILLENVDARDACPCPSLPGTSLLARTANRARGDRPDDPKDLLTFELCRDHLPANFEVEDLHVKGKRHILMYSTTQLSLLQTAKTWYMDGTFKVVKAPFTQLYSIHAFITSGTEMKQIPLVYCLMSSKRKDDYKKVLKRIKRRLPAVILLQRAVADFEAGLWKAMAKVFPGVTMGGCVFHFEQALFRHVQQLGMERAYRANNPTRTFLKKVFALPYLPYEHIRPSFDNLWRVVDPNVTPALDEFIKYVSDTWMESTVWPVANWCVYRKSIRTNNDVEGWHARLNRRATRGNLEFYLLLRLLKEESDLVNIQMRLVCEKKLKRNQRKKTRERQGQIFAIWDAYRENRSTASQLLREIGLLIGP